MASKSTRLLLNDLSELQFRIRRDSYVYRTDMLDHHRNFESLLEYIKKYPQKDNQKLEELIRFFGNICELYPQDLQTFPLQIYSLLDDLNSKLNPVIRLTACRTMLVLRRKNLMDSLHVFTLFFKLIQCHDRELRETLMRMILCDIKDDHQRKSTNHVLNSKLQGYFYKILSEAEKQVDQHAQRCLLECVLTILIHLWNNKVWNNSKTANAISPAVFSKDPKISYQALRFFAGYIVKWCSFSDTGNNGETELDDSTNNESKITASKTPKKTSEDIMRELKREHVKGIRSSKSKRRLEKAIKQLKKEEKKKNTNDLNGQNEDQSSGTAIRALRSVTALSLLHDPANFSERLMKLLETTKLSMEYRVTVMEVISRTIAIHHLNIQNFLPYVQKYLKPSQEGIIRSLACVVQACNDVAPMESIRNVIKTIADNFVTQNQEEAVAAVGLNTIREIVTRSPMAIDQFLANDLVSFGMSGKVEKAIQIAAKSLLNALRRLNPSVLDRKFRGGFTATSALREDDKDNQKLNLEETDLVNSYFLSNHANNDVFSNFATILHLKHLNDKKLHESVNKNHRKACGEINYLTGSALDKSHHHDEFSEEDEFEISDMQLDEDVLPELDDAANVEIPGDDPIISDNSFKDRRKEMMDKFVELCSTRILTEKEIEKIRMTRMKLEALSRTGRLGRSAAKVQNLIREFSDSDDTEDDDEEKAQKSSAQVVNNFNLMDTSGLENIAGLKRSHDRESRLSTKKASRETMLDKNGKMLKKNPHKNWRFNALASTTNAEKSRSKPFMMTKDRKQVKAKARTSYVQKLKNLKNSIARSKRNNRKK